MWVFLQNLNSTLAPPAGTGGGNVATPAQTSTALSGLNVWKVIYLLNSGNSGWSLSWYFNQVNPVATEVLEGAFNNFWAQALAPFFCSTVALQAIRYSAIGKPNLGDLILPDSLGPGRFGTATGTEDFPNLGWYIQLKDTSGQYRRMFWTRGMPKGWNTWTPSTHTQPNKGGLDLNGAVTGLQNALQGKVPAIAAVGQFGLRAWAKEVPPRVIDVPTNIQLDPDGFHYRVGFRTITPAVGDVVQISRVRGGGTNGINGMARITDIFAAVAPLPVMYRLSRTTHCGTNVVIIDPGKAIQSQYQMYPISLVKPIRMGTKKVGRPFFPTHGKQYKKRC